MDDPDPEACILPRFFLSSDFQFLTVSNNDTYRDAILRFCDDESNRCLVVPENLKIDNVIPSKLSKGKVLLFIKLRTCTLKMENIFSDVSIHFSQHLSSASDDFLTIQSLI